jgi:hypothetical protein
VTQGCVATAGYVGNQCIITHRYVGTAALITCERLNTKGLIESTIGVTCQRVIADGVV